MKLPKSLLTQVLCFLSFFIFLLASSPLGAVSYNPADFVAFIPPQPVTVQNQQGIAVFDAQHYIVCPGRPKLPKQVVRILLPEDADLSSLTYTLKNVKEDDLGGGWEVEAAKPYLCGDGSTLVPEEIKYIDGKDVDVYNANAFFPSNWAGPIKSGNMRRFKVANVEIYPYRYNPVTKVLKRITSATLMVNATPNPNYVPLKDPKSFSAPEASSLFFLKTHVSNMNAFSSSTSFDSYYPSYISASLLGTILQAPKLPPLLQLPDFPSRVYVIISTNRIVSDASPPSQKLESFILNKESRLFDVTLVTEDKTYEIVNGDLQVTDDHGWGGGLGDTGAENIRGYLTADVGGLPRWDAWDIEHLLLIGNPDPEDGTLPMKSTFPFFERYDENHPTHFLELATDLYYSELTENWTSPVSGQTAPMDINLDVAFDLLPEVSVTRIPVAYFGFDIAGLDDILEKIIAYTNESQKNIGWRKNVLLPIKPIAELLSNWEIGEAAMELCQQNGFGFHRIYDILCGYNIDYEFEEKLAIAVDNGVVAPHKVEDYENAFGATKNMFVEEPWFSNPENWQDLVDFFDDLNLEYDNGLYGAPQDDDTYNDDGTRAAYNEDVVRAAWLNQDFGFVAWNTHGSKYEAKQVFNIDKNGDFPPLDNAHPSFVFMGSCLNGYPWDDIRMGYTISYTLLHHGAIGTIAASNTTISLQDNFCVNWMRYMIEGQLELGTARTFTVAHQYAVGNDYELIAFNPYGDSTVGLFTCSTK